MKVLLVISAAFILFASCKSSNNSNVKLEEYKWVLEKLNNKKVENTSYETFILFDGQTKQVSGRAVCNRYFGHYEQNGNQLKFSQTGATKMACPDMELENNFFKVLTDTDRYETKDGKLLFKSGNNVLAEFKSTSKEE